MSSAMFAEIVSSSEPSLSGTLFSYDRSNPLRHLGIAGRLLDRRYPAAAAVRMREARWYPPTLLRLPFDQVRSYSFSRRRGAPNIGLAWPDLRGAVLERRIGRYHFHDLAVDPPAEGTRAAVLFDALDFRARWQTRYLALREVLSGLGHGDPPPVAVHRREFIEQLRLKC